MMELQKLMTILIIKLKNKISQTFHKINLFLPYLLFKINYERGYYN